MAIIRIKNLLVRTIIGFNPEERVNRQDAGLAATGQGRPVAAARVVIPELRAHRA